MTETHTPLPWTFEVHELSEGYSAIIYDANGLKVLDHLREEQAAFIVHAVNSHHDLIEALREAEAAIAEYYRYWTGGETRGSYDGKPERQGLWNARYKARAILTKEAGRG